MSSVSDKILASIGRGTVFYYSEDIDNSDGTKYRGVRFFVVLNSSPKTDDFLILATITKQIASRKKFMEKIGEDPSTLVPISPSEFTQLKVESVVNCNKVYTITLKKLIEKIEGGGFMCPDQLPKPIISAIISGVMKSSQIEGEYKSIIL